MGSSVWGRHFYLPGAVEAVIHDLIAAFVLDRSDFEIESIWDQVFSYCNFFGYAGAEMRALSAVDIALWDLLGQRTGQPIYNLLGGMVQRYDSRLQYLRRYRSTSRRGSFPEPAC